MMTAGRSTIVQFIDAAAGFGDAGKNSMTDTIASVRSAITLTVFRIHSGMFKWASGNAPSLRMRFLRTVKMVMKYAVDRHIKHSEEIMLMAIVDASGKRHSMQVTTMFNAIAQRGVPDLRSIWRTLVTLCVIKTRQNVPVTVFRAKACPYPLQRPR